MKQKLCLIIHIGIVVLFIYNDTFGLDSGVHKNIVDMIPTQNYFSHDTDFLSTKNLVHNNLQMGNDKDTTEIPEINVLEIRNYILKPGKRDSFIQYFEENFINSQRILGGYPLGVYKVKGFKNNFFWIRGFENMVVRSKFLPAFYRSPFWKQFGPKANRMIVNNDNVHLLTPLTMVEGNLKTGKATESKKLKTSGGIAVIDFYISNTKLDKLILAFSKIIIPLLQKNQINNFTLWVSEPTLNDFPALPVFQDKNLLVAISFYQNERLYRDKQKNIYKMLNEEDRILLEDLITLKTSLILYPEKTSK